MWVIMDLIFIAHFETLNIEKEYCKQRCLICLEKARRWDLKQDTEVACLGGTADGEDSKQQRESPGHTWSKCVGDSVPAVLYNAIKINFR